jgi:hypothetical protein
MMLGPSENGSLLVHCWPKYCIMVWLGVGDHDSGFKLDGGHFV